ncbi:MAG: hypothetical protein JOY96_12455, partial [Verrucomicrobia bacterium]|nr:hypothetical protein [Verrucomicrobiota bacterium]
MRRSNSSVEAEGNKSSGRLRFYKQTVVWVPTRLGVLALAMFIGLPTITWLIFGESFLMHDNRVTAQVLVIDAWIGVTGVQAAAEEFRKGGYQSVLTTGGTTWEGWKETPMNCSALAAADLASYGIPKQRIIEVTVPDVQRQRTFTTAAIAWQTLKKRGIEPEGLNVFTFAMHARRTQLVFSKVFPNSKVGSIGWEESYYIQGPWWRSSERAKDFLVESVGYFYELLFNSGRRSNLPTAVQPAVSE